MRDKRFLDDFRERPTASEVLLKDFGIGGGPSAVIHADEVQAQIQLSGRRAFAGQELGIAVDFTVKPPWHIYGEPLPKNYTATAIHFDDASVSRQSLRFPKPQPVKVASLGEVLPVYTGSLRAAGTLVLSASLEPGEHRLGGNLSFQECNSEICKLPRSVAFTLPLTIEPPAAAAKK